MLSAKLYQLPLIWHLPESGQICSLGIVPWMKFLFYENCISCSPIHKTLYFRPKCNISFEEVKEPVILETLSSAPQRSSQATSSSLGGYWDIEYWDIGRILMQYDWNFCTCLIFSDMQVPLKDFKNVFTYLGFQNHQRRPSQMFAYKSIIIEGNAQYACETYM